MTTLLGSDPILFGALMLCAFQFANSARSTPTSAEGVALPDLRAATS